jgi:hypothetical protein
MFRARDEHRLADYIHRFVVTDLRHLDSEGEHQWQTRKNLVHLRLPTHGIKVIGHRHPQGALGLIGRALFDVLEQHFRHVAVILLDVHPDSP